MFKILALANTFAVVDLLLHPLFHIWAIFSPRSYAGLMNLFVAGLHLQVTAFDTDITHMLLGTIIEAFAFWLLGAVVAIIYNQFAKAHPAEI